MSQQHAEKFLTFSFGGKEKIKLRLGKGEGNEGNLPAPFKVKGYQVNPTHVKNRWKSLLAKYRAVEDHNNKSGNDTMAGRPFREKMDKICGEGASTSLGQEFRLMNPSPHSFPSYSFPSVQPPPVCLNSGAATRRPIQEVQDPFAASSHLPRSCCVR